MARTHAFEENQVLDRAMAPFWRQGFEATSIEELVAASGINRGSMYAAFGDKRGLFMPVLDHYRPLACPCGYRPGSLGSFPQRRFQGHPTRHRGGNTDKFAMILPSEVFDILECTRLSSLSLGYGLDLDTARR
jgi:hypothetical protein